MNKFVVILNPDGLPCLMSISDIVSVAFNEEENCTVVTTRYNGKARSKETPLQIIEKIEQKT